MDYNHQRKGHFSHSLGDCINTSSFSNGLVLETANDIVYVTFYSQHIIRIRVVKKGEERNDFSYGVIAKPIETSYTSRQEDSKIIIETEVLKLIIDLAPIRFSFYTKQGKLINADDAAFGSSRMGTEVTTYKKLQEGERFIGLGEKTGGLDRRGNAYTNWNTDKFAYTVDADPIYMSIPFYIGVHSGLCYGIFFDNSHKTKFNFGASNNRFSSFSAEDGEMDYYFIYDEQVKGIINHYTWLTGKMELPPIWSLGLQQCRYSYYPDKQVLNIAKTFRQKGIPADVIYLDIHYMDDFKVFSFHPERFPNPAQMTGELKAIDFHTVVILDPGIKVQPGYGIYDEGIAHKHFVTYPDGEAYSGEVWPGWSHFPDFTKPAVRDWWGDKMQFYTERGIDGFWNDMNEPAAWGQSLPDLIEFEYEGEGTTHKRARNVYGMQMARSTYEGSKKQLDNKRPFVLNRAGYSGVQRYAASWTGDNVATDDHMLGGVRLLNSMGLSGLAYTGYDVGGFAGDASADLFVKWVVLGAFSPMFRLHSMINSKGAEPWSFGEEAEEIAKNYITLRYRLLPYIYSTFYESVQNGLPIMRSLAIEHTHDDNIYNPQFENQYYFGHALLIPPITSGKQLEKVYLPTDVWYDLHTGAAVSSGIVIADVRNERYPIFIKGSSIIPMQSPTQSTSQLPTEVLEIHLYFGDQETEFIYFEDDGKTYNYLNNEYFKRTVIFKPNHNTVLFTAVEGIMPSKFKTIKLYFHGFMAMKQLKMNEQSIKIGVENYQFITPVSNFDPFYHTNTKDMVNADVPFVEFENQSHAIEILY